MHLPGEQAGVESEVLKRAPVYRGEQQLATMQSRILPPVVVLGGRDRLTSG